MLSYQKTVAAKPLEDYRVEVVFGNGVKGLFDCSYLLDFAMTASLADKSIFNQVHAEHGTLVWPDDIDVAPEIVWERSVKGDSPTPPTF